MRKKLCAPIRYFPVGDVKKKVPSRTFIFFFKSHTNTDTDTHKRRHRQSMGKYPFKKKTYQERAQPMARRKLGFLEKHKDYVKRAQDHHKKEKQLLKLKKLAQNRNPDEFRFGMEHTHVDSQTGQRRHDSLRGTKGSNKYSADEIRLMQTEDIAYLTMRQTIDQRKAEKLRANLHDLDMPSASTHTLFVGSDSEQEDNECDEKGGVMGDEEYIAKKMDTLPELIHTKVMPKTAQLKDGSIVVGGDGAMNLKTMLKNEKDRAKAYKEIKAREARAKRIKVLAREMEIKKQLAGPGKKYKLYDRKTGGANFVWRLERKK